MPVGSIFRQPSAVLVRKRNQEGSCNGLCAVALLYMYNDADAVDVVCMYTKNGFHSIVLSFRGENEAISTDCIRKIGVICRKYETDNMPSLAEKFCHIPFCWQLFGHSA